MPQTGFRHSFTADIVPGRSLVQTLPRLALAATGAGAGIDPWRSFETARRDLRAAGVSLSPDPRIL